MNPAALDLNKLHTFAAVAGCGGVSAAARRLGLTPSAVSQALGVLEAQLETPLFHRVGRRMVLTREGETLQRRFLPLAEELSRTLDDLVNAERSVRGTLRVGLYLGFPRDRLADLLAAFTDRHPSVSVRVRYEGRDDLERGLLDGRIDLALALSAASARPIRATRLLRQSLLLVAHPDLAPRRLRFEDLAGLPFVDYFPQAPLLRRWIRHQFRRRPPALRIRVWAASANLALELALRRVGAAVLPDALAQPHLDARRLVELSGGRGELTDAIWLKALPASLARPSVAAFRDLALATFAGS